MCSKLSSKYVVGIGMISGDGGDGGDSDDGGDLDAVRYYAVVPCADDLEKLSVAVQNGGGLSVHPI